MKSRSKLFVLLALVLASTSANAENFLMAENTNDPVYTGDANDVANQDVADSLTNSLINSAATTANEQVEGNSLPQETLATRDVSVKRFFLKDCQEPLTERVSDQLSENNLALDNLSFKRTDGQRSFTYDQVKNVQLKTQFSVSSLEVNENEGRFSAVLKPQSGSYKIEVSGDYNLNQKVPVLSHNIGKGEKITQDDIELKATEISQIPGGSITEVNNIIGKTATHGLNKGKMVSGEDIRDPITISKNSTVSAIFRTESIEIKALAVALEDGSAGDIIRLKNFDSGKVFKAIVQDDGSVLIGTSTKEFTASLPSADDADNFN